jgi:hypothetical protein
MKFTKRYAPRSLNFHLLPDLMRQIETSIPEPMLVDRGDKLKLAYYFLIKTNSQTASTEDSDEFRDILRSVSEPILSLDAEVYCRLSAEHLSGFDREPPAFSLEYRQDSIEVVLARNSAETIRRLFSLLEEAFTLEFIKPTIREERDTPPKKTVFIAHSFDPVGKSYVYELIKFLNLIGFKVSTGEGFSPERVSKKVRDRLTSQEVVIVIVSQQEDTTWLIQEATGATFAEKPLILLIEQGVEFKPGILGDLEYIQFSKSYIASTFVPILEGLQSLGYKYGTSNHHFPS